MDWPIMLTLIIGGMLLLLATGLPVAFVFLVVNLIGAYFLWGGMTGLFNFVYSVYSSVTNFALLPVLLFVLMGEVLFHSRLAFKAVDVVDKWLGRVPGRLCLVSIGAATLFAALSGSSMGTSAMLGTTMLPEMKRRGYHHSVGIFSCISGGLAMIIPPSALAVVLASICQVSVGKVLIGGVVPGIALAIMYVAYILARCLLNPSIAPEYDVERTPLLARITFSMRYLFPMAIIIFIVVGLIFFGVATPTESAALGAFACFVLAAAEKKLDKDLLKKSVTGTLKITVMMFTILTGSVAFSQILAYSGATAGLVQYSSTLSIPPILIVILMQLVLLGMGCFMEPVAIMMIAMPIFMPVIKNLGYNEIWFSLMVLLNMEIGMKTPPFGFILFVMRGVVPPEISTIDIYKSALPIVIIDAIGVLLIMLFPDVILWLPNMMIGQ